MRRNLQHFATPFLFASLLPSLAHTQAAPVSPVAAQPVSPPSAEPPAAATAQPSEPSPPQPPQAPAPVAPQPPAPVVPQPPPAAPSAAPRPALVEFATLRLLRERGVISQSDFDATTRELAQSIGGQAANSLGLVIARWSTTLYGFVEADHIVDSTQTYNDIAGSALVVRPGSYGSTHPRVTFAVRNSRLGFRLASPEWRGLRASAVLEMDFLGNQPPNATEAATFTSPGFRIRHFFVRLQTPVVDVLVGQYWHLFGWQPLFQPNSVQIQGVPGELYARTPQIRLSRVVHTDPVDLEFAIAAMRPPERDSATPAGQAGIRMSFNHWTGMQTVGSTASNIAPGTIAVSADVRRFSVAEFSAAPRNSVDVMGWGINAGAFLPLLPGDANHRGNTLSLHGEFSYSYGLADLYTGLNGGVANAALPNPMMSNPAPVYAPATGGIDPGLAVFRADGTLEAVQWTSVQAGAQYYFPRLDGNLWLSANYARHWSNNSSRLGDPTRVRSAMDWMDVNLFFNPLPALRFGFEYSLAIDHYADGMDATNHRGQFSAFFLF